jgi:hypothetical protein
MGDALLNVHRDYAAAQRKREAAMKTVERLTAAGFGVVRKSMGL